jgi:hypothetical protein
MVVDQSIVDGVVGVLVVVVPLLAAWVKKVLGDKGVGEAQTDMMFDFADSELAALLKLYPDNQEIAELRVKLLKLKAFYNDPKTTEDEMKALLNAVQNIRFRTLKQTPSA